MGSCSASCMASTAPGVAARWPRGNFGFWMNIACLRQVTEYSTQRFYLNMCILTWAILWCILCGMNPRMITIKLDEMLEKKGRTLYWLATTAGIPHNTLRNMSKKETQKRIDLTVVSRMCAALDC